MSYYFGNMDDKALEALSAAVYAEQKARITANISSYPVPTIVNWGNMVENIKLYREQHGTSLMVAKMVVEHYINKE